MSDAALGIDSNVTIRCIDKYGKVIRTARLHNKATSIMVQGLLEFLAGHFVPTKTNPKEENVTPEEMASYIPVSLRFGNVGVKMDDRKTDKPVLRSSKDRGPIEYSEIKTPAFNDHALQNDITSYYIDMSDVASGMITFDTTDLTNYDNPNTSTGLLLQAKLPAGRLVGVGKGEDREYFTDNTLEEYYQKPMDGRGWSYYNPSTDEYEAMFTELGLYSNNNNLLARVVFDGEILEIDNGKITYRIDGANNNPIVQTDSTSLVIEWRIGIVSLGQNDHVVSATNKVPKVEESN